jgi:hypothetical protein
MWDFIVAHWWEIALTVAGALLISLARASWLGIKFAASQIRGLIDSIIEPWNVRAAKRNIQRTRERVEKIAYLLATPSTVAAHAGQTILVSILLLMMSLAATELTDPLRSIVILFLLVLISAVVFGAMSYFECLVAPERHLDKLVAAAKKHVSGLERRAEWRETYLAAERELAAIQRIAEHIKGTIDARRSAVMPSE